MSHDQLEAAGHAFLDDRLSNTPMGLRLTKETLNESITASSLEAAMAFEDRHQSLLSRTADSEEAIQAFLQKRAPDSQGKSFFELRVFFSSEGYKDNNA